ncbi:MAG: ABC transporter permease [Clostridiales bacterium]|nr:ABC transporter permease [Clostridiales bacterium]
MKINSFKKRFSVFEIAAINFRHNSLISVIVAALFCSIIPLFVGIANLDVRSAAMPLEMFVSLIGIVLLTPVFQPEQNEEIRDLVSSKSFSTMKVYLIRLIYLVIFAFLFISLFAIFMKLQHSDITLILVIGTLIDALFLGAIGMFTSALTGNTVMGYMAGLLYYALNVGMGNKLGCFYLFSMTFGQYASKCWLALAGFAMVAISLLYQKIVKVR